MNGTAPLEASSGEQVRHRLSRAGNRRINHVLHIMAIVQLRNDTLGRAYHRRLVAGGKTPMEALRCLKRRLSDVVYRQLLTGVTSEPVAAGPGGHAGATADSCADDLATPMAVSSDKSLPGPATNHATPDGCGDDLDDRQSDAGGLEDVVETIDLPALALLRRASAGAGPGLPTTLPARARRGSTVKGGPQGRPAGTRSALDGAGASPYARGARTTRKVTKEETGGEAATAEDLQPRPTKEAKTNPLT